MFLAVLTLLLLILLAPAFILFDGPIVQGSVLAGSCILTLIIGLRIRPGEAGFLVNVFRPVAIVAGAVAIYMLIQVLPLKVIGLANPIWESAASTLVRPLAGSISIDPGQTLVCFARCLSIAAIAFATAAIAADRHYAEGILLTLTTASAIIAVIAITTSLSNTSPTGGNEMAAVTDSIGLGIILSLASAAHAAERRKAQTEDNRFLAFRYSLISIASLVAVIICGLAFIQSASSQTYFAVGCGVATLVVARIIRRFNFGPWGYSAIISIALVVAIAAIALQPKGGAFDLTLAFATRAPTSLLAVSQRILADTSWFGTGAGTFSAVLPIYQTIGEVTATSAAPTASVAIAIGLGRPALWIIILAAITLVFILLRGASQRRRDAVYPMVGAACIVAAVIFAFGSVGPFNTAFLIMTSAAIGLAFAQSKSRLI